MTVIKTRLVCEIILILGLTQLICGHHVYNVGDYHNWNPHVDYKAWVAGKTFYPGDVLEFKFVEGLNVKQVTAKDFAACKAENAILEDHSGKTAIPLNKTGNYYFICSLYDYCHMGMKLNVTVN
ncbi:Blue copper protein [Bienertia sinuspersici]